MTHYLLCVALAFGQTPTAGLYGTVRDSETGTPVQGATVELLDGGGHKITDDAGFYQLAKVRVGPRHLKVSGLGYKPRTLHIFVPADGALRVDVMLLPAPIPVQAIEASVKARSAPRATAGVSDDLVPRIGSRSYTYEDVSTHPGLAEPDFFGALSGADVRIDPESPNALHVRGGSGDQNRIALDGIPIFSPYHALDQFSSITPEAISRVDLHAGVTPVRWGNALSGVVELNTRRPAGDRVGLRGAMTPTGARLTADGPAAFGSGLLLSGAWGRPGFLRPPGDESYVRGSFAHGLAKLEWPLADGLVELLAFRSGSTMRTTKARAQVDDGAGADSTAVIDTEERNRFAWLSGSYGLSWERPVGEQAAVKAQVWYADIDVEADWLAGEGLLSLVSRRRNFGGRVSLGVRETTSLTVVGLDLEREQTAYAVQRAVAASGGAEIDLRSEPTMFALFGERQTTVLGQVQALIGLRLNHVSGDHFRLAPRASLSWPISGFLSFSAGFARTHQWVQSLRNPETPIAVLFSPDLSIAIGADGIPVARADQFTATLEAQPMGGVRINLQGYIRDLDGLLLVAPSTGQPFTVSDFAVGHSQVTGAGLSLEVDRARYRGLLSYGLSSVENEARGSEYRPGFAVSHSLATGVTYYPAAELELRTSLRVEFGRPTTLIEGPFGWEACAIIDGGCEAEGSPERRAGSLSGDRLPPYLRLDLGVRKHWHPRVIGREGVIVAFATVSNVLGRDNHLAYVSDPDTGELAALPMRPFTPLTAGLEWRF